MPAWKHISLFVLLFFGYASSVYAIDATLRWLPNNEPNLAGYRVFFREEGQSYDYANPSLEVAQATCNVNNLDENKTYYFVVRAFDTNGFESGDSNEVSLEAAPTPDNQAPTAVIAKDYIEAIPGDSVTLEGSRSTDADDGISSYYWRQVDGPPVALSGVNSKNVTFTAPETDRYGTNLTFRLTVTDFGGLQCTADCSVYITPEKTSDGVIQEPQIDSNKAGEVSTITVSGQQPYGGTPWPVPGIIEAEDYDTDGEGVGYHDLTSGNSGGEYRTDGVDIWYDHSEGYYTGDNRSGEWLEFTVDVASDSQYTLEFRVATPNSGRRMHVELDGIDVTGPINLPDTGSWNAWQTVSATASLSAGQHDLRVVFDTSLQNLSRIDISESGGGDIPTPRAAIPTITPDGATFVDSVNVSLQTSTPGATIYYTTDGSTPSTSPTQYVSPFTLTQAATVKAYAVAPGYNASGVAGAVFTISASGQQPFGGTPRPVPGTIEAEDYDTGGEGVGYHDRTSGNSGGEYRADGVDIWYDHSEGYYTGDNRSGEWLAYTVDVAGDSQYTLEFRVATPESDRRMHVELDGIDVTGPIHLPNTGSWIVWQTVSAAANLSAGRHVLRVVFDTSLQNFSRIDIYEGGNGT